MANLSAPDYYEEINYLGGVELPPPPSANRLWKVFRAQVVMSAEYMKWLKENFEEVRACIASPSTKAVRVEITLFRGSGVMKSADPDNFIKPCIDILTPERWSVPKKEGMKPQLRKPGSGVLEDDTIEHVVEVKVVVVPEPKKKGKRQPARVCIELWEMARMECFASACLSTDSDIEVITQ